MHEASYYTRDEQGAVVECRLCPHHCRIQPGGRGVCRVRENKDGRLVSMVYGQPAALHADPIEKKPLFHFLPGSSAFSVATLGCNLSCPFCQNYTLSSPGRDDPVVSSRPVPPEEIVSQAEASGCRTLCFTYSEPTVFFEYMLDLARLAKEWDLRTTMVSNGFIEQKPLEELAPWMDAANIDLKAFKEETYRKVLGGKLEPVLETITSMKKLGIWLEVTTLVVPEMNDSEQELGETAAFLARTSENIPWHVSRFHPAKDWAGVRPTGLDKIRLALEAGRREGLKYVYAGNVPGEPSESTICPGCGKTVIERYGFSVGQISLDPGGLCSHCGTIIKGVFE
ncbi:MAG: AmmeMemoRadiSam system radical SAM enzyme [Gemmatimonadota bacterium]|nr:AmmeMemoRadiSam system radical SAM enzyme [Gemmatimonadota bacterium]